MCVLAIGKPDYICHYEKNNKFSIAQYKEFKIVSSNIKFQKICICQSQVIAYSNAGQLIPGLHFSKKLICFIGLYFKQISFSHGFFCIMWRCYTSSFRKGITLDVDMLRQLDIASQNGGKIMPRQLENPLISAIMEKKFFFFFHQHKDL